MAKFSNAPRSDEDGVRQTWDALVAAGYEVTAVQDGAGEVFEGLDKEDAIAEAMSCDDGYFYTKAPDGKESFIWFVYGNSPEEVICDYGVSLSVVIDPLTKKWGW